jgi:hypothetical protein
MSTGAALFSVDPQLLKILKDSTDDLYRVFPNALRKLNNACDDLAMAGKPHFKKRKFLRMQNDGNAATKANI